MLLKTFVLILSVAFVLANPIQDTTETKSEEVHGFYLVEGDETNDPTSIEESKVEENETPEPAEPFSTELPIEEPVKNQEEQEVQKPVTEKATIPPSTEVVTEQVVEVITEQVVEVTTEQVVEVTTEQPKKSVSEKIESWLADLRQKFKDQWEAIKNKISNIIH